MRTRRRRVPLWLLALLFLVIPLVEIYVLIQVGKVIGVGWTIVALIADSFLGGWLIKREGGRAFRQLGVALSEGRMPSREIADGILILLGGILMLSPGFVLDVFGLVLVLPFTRPFTSIWRESGTLPPTDGGIAVISQPHFCAETSRTSLPNARSASITAFIAIHSMRERAAASADH